MNFASPLTKSSVLAFVALAILTTPRAAAAESKRLFRADAPDAAPYTLPDPLITQSGRKITTAAEWESVRRPEVLELFRQHVYGRVPTTPYKQTFTVVNENPRAMNGAATLKQIAIKIEAEGGQPVTINLSLFIPNARTKPAPAFLLICNRSIDNIDPTREKKSEFWPAEEGIARGYAMAAFFNGDVDPDKKDSHDQGIHGLLNRGTPAPDAWGTLASWAWGASRCMDYLQTDPGVAKDQVAVIGHSRGGKTALWAGAEDKRFALVCSNDSGCGGAALSRRKTREKETLAVINRSFPHWFNTNFKSYSGREADLPVDQHMLVALIAPRAVAVHSAEQDLWADPRGEFLSVVHARPVFQLYGKQALGAAPQMPAIDEPLHGDGAQYHIRDGKHNLILVDWTSYWDFADRVFGRKK
jgi:dienelactone hydrolase